MEATQETPETQQPQAEQHPRCPGCGQRPATVKVRQLQFGHTVIVVYYCGMPECGIIYSVVPIAVQRAEPRVVVPGAHVPN